MKKNYLLLAAVLAALALLCAGCVSRPISVSDPGPGNADPLTLYENGSWAAVLGSIKVTVSTQGNKYEFGEFDVSEYTRICYQFAGDYIPDGYFGGQVGGHPSSGFLWVQEDRWESRGGMSLNGNIALMGLGPVKRLMLINFDHLHSIDHIARIWLE